MRKIILFLAIVIAAGCTAQTKVQKKKSLDQDVKFIKQDFSDSEVTRKYVAAYDSLNKIAATSPNKDTLYLPDDSIGKSIQQIWVQYPLKVNPTIVFVKNDEVLLAMIRKQKTLAVDRQRPLKN
jgi:hypothetical protein